MMEEILNHKLEKDAAPIPGEGGELEVFGANRTLAPVENIGRSVNNNMVLSNQTNTSSVIRFDNCNQITLGNVFNVGLLGGNGGVVAPRGFGAVKSKEDIYAKTKTIKRMMNSTDPISPAFLDILSGNFGGRWRDVTIMLQIDKIFVERMYEDYDKRGGSKEVLYQIFSQFFKDNDDKATVGWIITYLWRNGFKEQVWNMREPWKLMEELEKDMES